MGKYYIDIAKCGGGRKTKHVLFDRWLNKMYLQLLIVIQRQTVLGFCNEKTKLQPWVLYFVFRVAVLHRRANWLVQVQSWLNLDCS